MPQAAETRLCVGDLPQMRQGTHSHDKSLGGEQALAQVIKHDMESLVADIAQREAKKLYEKRLTGVEEELAALYKTLDEYAHRI